MTAMAPLSEENTGEHGKEVRALCAMWISSRLDSMTYAEYCNLETKGSVFKQLDAEFYELMRKARERA